MIALALALAVAPPAAPAAAGSTVRHIVFQAGALGGLGMDTIATADGATHAVLRPSAANASPPAASSASAVRGYLAAYRNNRPRDLRAYLSKDATSSACETIAYDACEVQSPFDPYPFEGRCVANSPYQVDDGSVRIEWLHEGKLYYVTWLRFSEGKISAISTHPAIPPVLWSGHG